MTKCDSRHAKPGSPNRISTAVVCTLMRAFPMKVAPKNSQKGMRKCPQQIPHRSNAAFGQAASSRMPQKPWRWMKSSIHPLRRATSLPSMVFDELCSRGCAQRRIIGRQGAQELVSSRSGMKQNLEKSDNSLTPAPSCLVAAPPPRSACLRAWRGTRWRREGSHPSPCLPPTIWTW